MKIIFFIILIAGIGNTVLRPEMENPYTLYRILAPLGFLIVFLRRPRPTLILTGFFCIFFVYNLILASLYSSDYSQFFPSIVHYLYIFLLLCMMVFMKNEYPTFDRSFVRFVGWFYMFLLLNLMLEKLIGPYYPNLYVDESDDGSMRAFFWNQNDLAVVLCIVSWFALALDRFRGAVRVTVVILTVAILYINDSKAALFSFVFISVPVFFLFKSVKHLRLPVQFWLAIGGILLTLFILTLVALSDTELHFENDDYTLGELITAPILNIVRLQPSGEDWGSVNNRMDAAIFVLIEYFRTFGFGLGAGGSWLVLSLPKYKLGGAQSAHNALLQFTADFGYPVLLMYAYMVYRALNRLFAGFSTENDRLKVIAILSFPMVGLSQSGAILTNYFFWASIFYIFLLDHPILATRRSLMWKPVLRLVSPGSIRAATVAISEQPKS